MVHLWVILGQGQFAFFSMGRRFFSLISSTEPDVLLRQFLALLQEPPVSFLFFSFPPGVNLN